MSRSNRRAVLLAVSGIVLAGVGAYAFFNRATPANMFQGWVEAELLFIAPDEVGRVETLSVSEGQEVAAGAPLFSLDADLQRAAVAENEAAVVNARIAHQRAQELLKRAVGSQKAFDDAESALRTAEARLNSAKTRLDRRRVAAPAAGKIQEVYYRQGELVQPGRPIVSLLPPGNIKVRFFVPETELARISLGQPVSIHCDGCKAEVQARVTFISRQSEYTPPVIYSLDERSKLVFRVEAIPERPNDLRVGQPVTVMLQPAAGVSHASK